MNEVATVSCHECGVFTVSIDGPYSYQRSMAKVCEHIEAKHDRTIHEVDRMCRFHGFVHPFDGVADHPVLCGPQETT